MPLSFSISRADAGAFATGALAVLCPKGDAMPSALASLDTALSGAVSRSFARSAFSGKRDEVLHLAGGDSGPERVLLIGMGDAADRNAALKRASQLAGRRANGLNTSALAILVPSGLSSAELEQVVIGVSMGAWEYRELKTPPPEPKMPLERLTILVEDETAVAPGLASGECIAAGYALARRLQMMPGNLCTPDALADSARDIAARHGLEVTVLGRREMEALFAPQARGAQRAA